MEVKKQFTALAASAGILFAPVMGGLPEAHAHDVVMRANPGDGATIDQAPTELELEFSGIPKETFNTVALSNQDSGTVLFTATPTLDGPIIRAAVPEDVDLGPGHYKIGFQITSSDGHATRGMTTFTIAGDIPTASSEEEMVAGASESPWSNTQFLYAVIGVFIALIVIVVGVVLALSRRKK